MMCKELAKLVGVAIIDGHITIRITAIIQNPDHFCEVCLVYVVLFVLCFGVHVFRVGCFLFIFNWG